MFHVHNGLFFERAGKDTVRIVKTYDGREPRPDNVVLDESMTCSVFASVMASVCQRGETGNTHQEALTFLTTGA